MVYVDFWVCGFVGLWIVTFVDLGLWCMLIFGFVGLWCMLYSDVDLWVCGVC